MGTEVHKKFVKLCFAKVEKMGPLRGDGSRLINLCNKKSLVEKMGPLRGDGSLLYVGVPLIFLV